MKLKRWKIILLSEFLLVAILVNIDKTFILSCICILVHEATHILVAKLKGSRFNNLQFHIYGAKVELMDLEELTNKDKFYIYISGAMANIIIMSISWIMSKHCDREIFNILVKLNFSLAFFNLLPAYPLDGARVFEIILSRKLSFKKAQKIIAIISYVIATFFILVSISMAIFLRKFNISLLIIGAIIINITKIENKSTMYILMGNVFKKRNNVIKNGFIENKSISVHYKQGLVKVLTYVDKNRFNIFYILNDDMKLIYILNEDELLEALKLYGNISIEDYVNKKKDGS